MPAALQTVRQELGKFIKRWFWKQGAAEADTRALLALLAPDGKLFSAMHSADSDNIVQFSFPLERLPTHTQLLLASQAGRCAAGAWLQGLAVRVSVVGWVPYGLSL